MELLHPAYGWTLLAVPAALYILWRAGEVRRRSFRHFGETWLVKRLAPAVHVWRQRTKIGMVVLAIVGFCLALMGPRFGTQLRTVERRGVDVVVALDVSSSMRAEDVAPSRLRRAKNEVRDLLGALRGDRVGLVLFAGTGFVQCPLTTDYGALRLFLDVASPDQVPTPGTNFEAAFDSATDAFSATRAPSDTVAASRDKRAQVLLVLSDGENHIGNIDAIKREAEANDITVFAAGIGTQEGARIPVYEDGRRTGVQRNAEGRIIRTRLDEPALTSLAENGAYFRVAATASGLSDVPTALRQLETSVLAEEQFAEYAEMFQWPLAVGLLLLFIEAFIPARSRNGFAGGVAMRRS